MSKYEEPLNTVITFHMYKHMHVGKYKNTKDPFILIGPKGKMYALFT